MVHANTPAGDDEADKMSSPDADETPSQHDSSDYSPAADDSEAPSDQPAGEAGGDEGRMSGSDFDFSNAEGAVPSAASLSLDDGAAVIVRYGLMRHIGMFRHCQKSPPRPGLKVVIRTERGVEIGEVVSCACQGQGQEGCCYGSISPEKLNDFVKANGPEYPFHRDGKILRIANSQDVIDNKHLRNSAAEERAFCRNMAREMALPMRIVAVDHLLGGERIIFYFSSESRVDFRDLVRRLASQYHTRIEMRQVGARDEARLVADYEKCGQQVCCQSYMKNLRPVSMRMAKTQKASLDPTKISGRCGRLMCCLRYEDAGYEELKKLLPRKNSWVRTEKQYGRVVDSQILTQLVMIELLDRTQVAVGNEEILERNCTPPTSEQLAAYVPREREERGPRVRLADQADQQRKQAEAKPAAEEPEAPEKTPAPRPQPTEEEIPVTDIPFYEGAVEEMPSREESDEEGPAEEVAGEGGEGGEAPAGGSESSRRRRRRRKKRGTGGQPGGQGGQGGPPRGEPRGEPRRESRGEPRGEPRGERREPPGGGQGQAPAGQGPRNEQGSADGRRRRRRRRRPGSGGGGAGGGAAPAQG